MIRGLSEYSKIGKQEVRSESVDVHGLLQEVLNHLSITPTMKVEISQKMPVLIAPKSALFVIFSNLIENAIKHNNKENGCIRIYSDEQSDYFEFTVEDDGPGIAPEYHEKIFALFQTLQSKDKVENIGMGLTLVKRMLEEYGGEIRIESGTVCGSKFIFTWFKNLDCS
jgi:light-regulated signal transduction histidine kinase (bacteriophytochrome)